MVLGKFMPPHLGHQYLVEFAQRFVDELYVVVGTLAAEPIPGRLRYHWMRRLFPDAHVLHLDEELPQAPEEHPEFWDLWRTSLRRILPSEVDFVFASEDYGRRLADELGARFVPVDKARGVVPVSGTAVREAPRRNWAYIPPCVRPYFVTRISVFGPESTGKSTLAARLAERFFGTLVPEYAVELISATGRDLGLEDMETIVRGQIAAEDHLAEVCRAGVLVCDTDPLVTPIWSETLFGEVPDGLQSLASARTYDLTLLLDVDVPWVDDHHRYAPEDRRGFFDRCLAALEAAGRPYVIVRGDWSEREAQAVTAVEAALAQAGR